MTDNIVLYGASGNSYTHWEYSMYGTYFQHLSGIYALARFPANGKFYLIFDKKLKTLERGIGRKVTTPAPALGQTGLHTFAPT